MKQILFFLPIVIGYDSYYIINNGDLLVCGNKSMNASYFNWFERDNVMFRDISKCA